MAPRWKPTSSDSSQSCYLFAGSEWNDGQAGYPVEVADIVRCDRVPQLQRACANNQLVQREIDALFNVPCKVFAGACSGTIFIKRRDYFGDASSLH